MEQLDLLGPDTRTRELLDVLAGDWTHARDREAVCDAIIRTADAHDGLVSNNEVRRILPSWVHPQVVGAVIAGLTRKGRLVVVGSNVSDDSRSGNGGKPQPVRRLVGAGDLT